MCMFILFTHYFAVCVYVQVAHFIMKNTGAMPSTLPTVVAGSDPLVSFTVYGKTFAVF